MLFPSANPFANEATLVVLRQELWIRPPLQSTEEKIGTLLAKLAAKTQQIPIGLAVQLLQAPRIEATRGNTETREAGKPEYE